MTARGAEGGTTGFGENDGAGRRKPPLWIPEQAREWTRRGGLIQPL